MVPEPYVWWVFPGDDTERVFEYTDHESNPINLTGYSAQCVVTIGSVSYPVTGSVDGVGGKVTVSIPRATTIQFKGNGDFSLKLTSPTDKVTTLAYGNVRIVQ